MNKDSKIYIAGHTGLVGATLTKKLEGLGYKNLILKDRCALNLLEQEKVNLFFKKEKIDYVFFVAGNIGGIYFNQKNQVSLLYDNVITSFNVVHAAAENKVKKLLFLSSSCFYPKETVQPIKEEQLLAGALEPTNEGHAIAKIAGSKLCQYYNLQENLKFITAISTNIYGREKSIDPDFSHVIPSLFYRFIEAKINNQTEVKLWGSGSPRREFIHVDDLAAALIFLMQNYESAEMVNIGSGKDIAISELALMIKDITKYQGDVVFDTTKPDGMKQKLLDISKITNLGWKATIDLEKGLNLTYAYSRERIEESLLTK